MLDRNRIEKPHDQHFDILVLGAGIVGAAVSFYLSKLGYKVAIIERDGPCAGATGACNGGISYLGKRAMELSQTLESLQLYQDLSKELGYPVELDQTRDMVLLGKGEEDLEDLEILIAEAKAQGQEARLLSRKKLLAYLPQASPLVSYAAVSPGGLQGVANPFSVTYAYLGAASDYGAQYRQADVQSLWMEAGRVRGVVTDQGEIEGDIVVNALGVDADRIWEMEQIDSGMVPQKGIVLVSEAYPRMFPGNLLNAAFMKKNPPEISLAIEQTLSGQLLLGAAKLINQPGKDMPPGIMEKIAMHAMSYVAGLEEVNIIRAYTGLRPTRSEGHWLGETKIRNVFAALGFGGSGITLAPYAGKKLAQIIGGKS